MEQLNRPQPNGPDKKIIIGPDGKKKYPEGTIFTRLKFKKSEVSGMLIGFVSQNPKTGRVKGVREDSEFPKQVCIVDQTIAPEIILGALYQVAIVPMYKKKGFIVIEATPYQFKADISTCYVPKACYIVEVKFGNKTIVFDPKDGRKASTRTIAGVKALLEKRIDVQNITQVVEDFVEAATDLLKKYERDGFYVSKGV